MNRTILLRKMAAGELGTTRQLGVRLRCDQKGLSRYMNSLLAEGLVESFYHHDGSPWKSGPIPKSWRVTAKGRAEAAKLAKEPEAAR